MTASRTLSIVLVVVAALAIATGIIKLSEQRGNLPSFARLAGNSYQGYVAIDNFAYRSELFGQWLVGADKGELAAFIRRDLHPTSLAVPAAVGSVSLLVGSIPVSFVLLSILATLLAALGVAQLASLGSASSAGASRLSAILFLSHLTTLRTMAQMVLDTFACALLVWAIVFTVRWLDRQSWKHLLAATLVLVVAVFCKASCLAFLATPFVASCCRDGVRGLLRPGAWLATAVPVIAVVAYLFGVLGAHVVDRDATHLLNSWQMTNSQLVRFTLEMALLLQLWPTVMLVRGGRASVYSRSCVAMAAVVLAATWCFHLPAIPRLYLPVAACLVAGLAPRVLDLCRSTRPRMAWLAVATVCAVVVGNLAVGLAGALGLFAS